MHLAKLALTLLSLGHYHPADYRVCAVSVREGEAVVACSPSLTEKKALFAAAVLGGYLPESGPWIQKSKAAIPELHTLETPKIEDPGGDKI